MPQRKPLAIVLTLTVLLLGVLPVAAAPPEDVLQRATSAVAIGLEKAQGFQEAPDQEHRAKGLERAAEAIAQAAERMEERGNGNAFGKGHAAAVHQALLDEISPSELPSHGEAVRSMVRALQVLDEDHPGRGKGLGKGTDD